MMNKKYRLIIPVHYREILADYFSEYDDMVVIPTKNDNEFAVYPGADVHLTLIDIPVELQPVLLQEIKEPVVLSADAYLGHMYNSSLSPDERKRHEKTYKFADENGRIREWQRPEQVELRNAAESATEYLHFSKQIILGGAFYNLEKALENLKPPYED
jgi:hypothetical protein